MMRTTRLTPRRLGMQSFRNAWQRLSVTLLVMVLTMAAQKAWADTENVTYVDADGNTQTITATVLTGSESDLYAGWYVVNSDITYTSKVTLYGDMNLILVDGKTMSIGTADSPISGTNAIDGSSYTLTIYGQSGQTGKLCAYNNSSSYDAVSLKHFNQHGGIVIINSNMDGLSVWGNLQLTQGSLNVISSGASKNAIYISNTLSISGGTLIANAAGYGIEGAVNFTGGNLTAIGTIRGITGNTNLNWTSTSNTFKCSKYGGNVTIAEGKTFYDGATPYSGTLNSSQKDAIAGKTLRPYSSNDFSVNNEGTEYTIHSETGWNVFCDMLDEFDHSTNGGYCFDGKTVKLGANISITRAAGNTGYHDFTGTFDGQGHTLTVNITDTGEQGTAPFRVISNATIRNLHVTGTVTGTTHAAGLVGKACAGTMLIENCLVETNVNSTVGNNRHCGGIVGHGFGGSSPVNLTLRNCVYAGTITCDQNYIGGLQGWSDGNTLTLENCLFAGNYQGTATGTAAFHPIALHNTGKTTNLTATNVFAAVAPTATNANFIAANGTKATGRTTAPASLGNQGATYSFMDMTVYENGLYYNGLYYVAPTLSTDNNGAYLINNEDDWTNFCDALYDNGTWNRFSGQTVKLGNDISVSRMAGYDNHDFLGTFDGNHKRLTFTATATANYLAPFRNVLGNSDTDRAVIRDLNVVTNITATDYRHTAGLIALVWGYVDVTNCNVTVDITATKGTQTELYPAGLVSQVVSGAQLTVSGCTVDGTISTDGKYAGGIIGIAQGSATITDCLSSVTIDSSTEGDGTHGGLVGVQGTYNGSTLNIEGCVFNGSLLGASTHSCGGFVGWRGKTINITNSLFAPTQVSINTTEGSTPCATFVRNGDSNTTITNCYYTDALGTAQGTQVYSISKGEYVTTLEINGDATQSYDVSGLSFYSAGFKCGDVLYAAANNQVSLTLAYEDREGYDFNGYTPTAGTLNGSTLTMPNENVTINADYTYSAPSELATTDLTSTTATLSWSGEQDSYNVRYRTAGTENYTLFEDFENLGNELPEDWTFDGAYWIPKVDGGHNSTYYLCLLSHDEYLITPKMDLSGQGQAILNFWYRNIVSGNPVQFEVYYRTEEDDDAWIWLWSSEGGHAEWTEKTINLPDLSADYQIGFYIVSGGPDICFDDIAITGTSLHPVGEWQTVNSIAATTTTVTGLTPETPYEWQVQGITGGVTDWSETATFTTPKPTTTLFAANATNDWTTWCSPKEWTVDDSQATVYTVSSVADGTVTLAPLSDATLIPAYMPLLIQRKPQVTDEVVATFAHDGDPSNLDAAPYSYTSVDYFESIGTVMAQVSDARFYGNTGTEGLTIADLPGFNADTYTLFALYNGAFLRVGSTTGGFPANRCLLAVKNSALSGTAASRLAISISEPTSISEAEANSSLFTLHSSLSEWFTLDGRKLDGKPSHPGVYIYNGKKQVIKK